MTPKLTQRESFGRFLEAPSREALRELLRDGLGEFDQIEFKQSWPKEGKLARHILAMANSGSGCIVIGVVERDDKTFEISGVGSLDDKTDVKNRVKRFLPPELQSRYEILDISYEESEFSKIKGKTFQVVLIAQDPSHIPFLAMSDGEGISQNRIYVRANNASTEADHHQVQQLLAKRISNSSPTPKTRALQEHLAELRALYREVPTGLTGLLSPFGDPMRGFNMFLDQLINAKQAQILKLVQA